MTGPMVALAYSGGLDTSVAARWLAEKQGHDVVAVLVDLGQPIDRAQMEARAAAARAELVVVDARREFVAGYCWPALQANALYEGKYPLVSALARPLIAAKVVEAARAAGAGAVAHGCTGKGNDQVRFETTFAALAPDLQIMAPVRETAMSREESIALAREWGIPISSTSKVYSVDENLWGRTVECGPLEDPWSEPPADAFGITVDPRDAPDDPQDVMVSFVDGLPNAVDGVPMDPIDLVAHLAAVGGRHGVGRVDMIENRLVGIKSRELYEVPAPIALILAHRDMEDLTLERDLAHEKAGMERRWAELAYYGQWHGPLHAALRSFVESTQAGVTGDIRLRFHKGSCRVMGRRSPVALYDVGLATYEAAADRFDHHHAEGFIRLWSLPIRTWAARGREPSKEAPPAAAPPPGLERTQANGQAVPAPQPPSGGHARPLWSGRFSESPSEGTLAFTRSLGFDVRLAPYDIMATRAHVAALCDAGIVSPSEAEDLTKHLEDIGREIAAGTFEWDSSDEDVHSAVERALIERLGPTGAMVHAGRSRNDLVVTDLRLWVAEQARALARATGRLAGALADRAQEHPDAIMPGYTHLQRAQPVLLAHHLLAHAFPLVRDMARLEAAARSASISCLGAGALSGSTLPLDVEALAARLGMEGAFENSIDAVSDRDFALEFLSAGMILAVHLSRLAEDAVLWSTEEFGFARLAEAHITGSSMMPQKRNPDVAELTRAKAGRILGDLVTLATVMKGLPLAYDRDLQEDKEPLFGAADTLTGTLKAMTEVVRGLRFDTERMRAAAGGWTLATDLAEHLVAGGMPFREAHGLVGRIVAELEREGRSFSDVAPTEWRSWSPLLDPGTGALLTAEAGVERRATAGGTSPDSVQRQLATLRERLAAASR